MNDFETVPIYKLTTIDNPFHPVKERDQWERYDSDYGHNCDALVQRVAATSIYLSDAENQRAENDAIDDIIRLDLEQKYRKILITDDEEDDE